jgi:hypothetical protein
MYCETSNYHFDLSSPRTIIESQRQSKLIINFIDFKKVFDSLHSSSLWKILTFYGIPSKYTIFRCVRTESGDSSWFLVETEVKQGCVLSPILFCIAIDWVKTNYTGKIHLGIKWVK